MGRELEIISSCYDSVDIIGYGFLELLLIAKYTHVDIMLLNLCDLFGRQESTIGAAFFSQTLAVNDATVKFEIWDTAGQERYHSLAPMYYRGAAAAIIVYDITSSV